MKENQRKECVFFFFSKISLQKRRSKKYFGGELEIIEKKEKKRKKKKRKINYVIYTITYIFVLFDNFMLYMSV